MYVASSDYRYEIAASKEVFNRVSDSYRRIRNTLRFLLANLNGFKPSTDALPVDQLIALDQYILQRAHEVQQSILTAYDEMNFHVVCSSLTNFCINDLGGFIWTLLKIVSTPPKPTLRHVALRRLRYIISYRPLSAG